MYQRGVAFSAVQEDGLGTLEDIRAWDPFQQDHLKLQMGMETHKGKYSNYPVHTVHIVHTVHTAHMHIQGIQDIDTQTIPPGTIGMG